MNACMEDILKEEFTKEFGEDELESEEYRLFIESMETPWDCTVSNDYMDNNGRDVVTGQNALLCARNTLHEYLNQPEKSRHTVAEDLTFYLDKAGKKHLSNRLTEILNTAYQFGIRKRKAEFDATLETQDNEKIKEECARLYKIGPEDMRDYILDQMLPTTP